MWSPSGEKVTPSYIVPSAGATICTPLPVPVCITHRLCCLDGPAA
jgi:hypothetical protein